MLTKFFRVSYPKLFKPELNNLSGELEYSVVALFPKGEDLEDMKVEALRVTELKWGKDRAQWPKGLKSPFRDQGEKAQVADGRTTMPDGYEEGAVFITFKTKQRPGIVDQNVQDIIDETQLYAGCWARASVNAFAYANKSKGVSFGLQHIQKVRDDECLSGRTSPQDDFAPIAGAAPAVAASSSALDLFS